MAANYILICGSDELNEDGERMLDLTTCETLEEANYEGLTYCAKNHDNNAEFNIYHHVPNSELVYFFALLLDTGEKIGPVAFSFRRADVLKHIDAARYREGASYRLYGWKIPARSIIRPVKDIGIELCGYVQPDLIEQIKKKPIPNAEKVLRKYLDLEEKAPPAEAASRKPSRSVLGAPESPDGSRKLKGTLLRLGKDERRYFVRMFSHEDNSYTTFTAFSREEAIDLMKEAKEFFIGRGLRVPDMYAFGWNEKKLKGIEEMEPQELEERFMKGGSDDFILFHLNPEQD